MDALLTAGALSELNCPPRWLASRDEIHLGRAAFEGSSGRLVYRAVHGDGCHFAPSGSFLKCVLVTKVCWRYWGSSTMVVMIR
jgi:hypothetical protein